MSSKPGFYGIALGLAGRALVRIGRGTVRGYTRSRSYGSKEARANLYAASAGEYPGKTG